MTKRKNKHAVALGKRGGKRSQANKTPEQRSADGRKAANARHAMRKIVGMVERCKINIDDAPQGLFASFP